MPRAYLWVMTAATVPGVTLLLFFVGIAVYARAYWAASRQRWGGPRPPPNPPESLAGAFLVSRRLMRLADPADSGATS